jgi:hypothetical protein
VGGNVTVANGTGFDSTSLLGKVSVGGNLTIINRAGGSLVDDDGTTELQVAGRLSVTNWAGDDTVSLDTAKSIRAGAILIRHGLGKSTTFIQPSSELKVDRNLAVLGGDEFDSVQIGSFVIPVEVGGHVAMNVGEGGSSVGLSGKKLTVKGNIGVRAADGKDSVSIESLVGQGTVGGTVAIGLGSGDTNSAVIKSLSIGGGLSVRAFGSKSDQVTLASVQVGLQTVIATGAGSDHVMVGNCTFGGPFNLFTGVGIDKVEISGFNVGGNSHFKGTVKVRTGDGDDSVAVAEGGFSLAVFDGATYWDGGPGMGDKIIFDVANEFNGPQPVIVGFENPP